jgi:hypothetical protein
MEEQSQFQPTAKSSSGMVKIIMINVLISAVVAAIVSFVMVSALTAQFSGLEKRVVVLEQKVDKILSKFVIK